MKAYVLIRTYGGKAKAILKEVRAMDDVVDASGVYGSYDIIAKAESENVADIVIDKIRTLEGVSYTNTLIVAL